MGSHKDQYLDLSYLPCTPLHLVIPFAIIVCIPTFILMIRNYIYIIFIRPGDWVSRETAIFEVQAYTKDINTWMTNIFLKLNDDKTVLIIVTTSETTRRQKTLSWIYWWFTHFTQYGTPEEPWCLVWFNLLSQWSCEESLPKCKLLAVLIRKYLDKPTTEI